MCAQMAHFVRLLIACATLQISSGAPGCGNPSIKPDIVIQARIAGGDEAKPHSWPWQAVLYERQLPWIYNGKCGGVLISPDWVLTAAHCVTSGKRYKVKLGAHNRWLSEFRYPFEMSMQQVIKVSKIVLNPQYGHGYTHDIALLRLETSARMTDYVSPICLPPASEVLQPGEKAVISGWGNIAESGSSSQYKLRQTTVPIVENQECQRLGYFDATMLCAGTENGDTDACRGDSGGPLVVQRNNTTWVLHGLVSFGWGCARKGYPGVYARISALSEWITSETGVQPWR